MALRDDLYNWDVLNAIRSQASNEYQRRVPAATKANIQETLQAMWRYQPTRNEFIDALVNRIGLVLFAEGVNFENPLAKFKIGMLDMGDTIEEVMVNLIQATTYDPQRDSLEKDVWGQEIPDVQSSFHKVNRQDKYKVTVNQAMLQRAFLDPQGLAGFAGQIMAAPAKSDKYDEFLLMCQLFPEFYNAGGFFKVNVPDLTVPSSTPEDARYFLRRTREYADIIPFPSPFYNPAGMHVNAQREDMELFITPEANAAADVDALAAAFNIERALMPQRTTVIPKERFGIPGAQAILTTKDFFKCADTLMESRSISNPDGLYDNYWLHHHEIISASRFVPAILFTTEPSDVIEIVDTPVTSIAPLVITDSTGAVVTEVERGKTYQLSGEAVTTPEGGYNSAVQIRLTGQKSNLTVVTYTGILVVGFDEEATSLTVERIAQDDNDITATSTVDVVGDLVVVWPNPEVKEDNDDDGLFEVVPEDVPPAGTAGANKNKTTIPEVEGVDYKDGAATVTGTITITANKTITAVAQAGYEIKAGSTTSWDLIFTP